MSLREHHTDDDCEGFVGEDDICSVCGVHHGDPCPECGGRGFHSETCPEVAS